MITEELLLSIYAVLLLEVGLLLLILILIVLDIKNTVDSIKQVINKFVKLGHITADTAEEFKSKITSLSGLTSVLGGLPAIISIVQNWSDRTKPKEEEQKEEDDDLGEVLSKVSPKKRKRII
jgi:hypothetical protein